jgi:hypothetical protein
MVQRFKQAFIQSSRGLLPGALCLILGGGIGWPQPLRAESDFEVRNTYLTVGHGWAVVRELRTSRTSFDQAEILLDGIPPEADLSSLVVRARRMSLEMNQWNRAVSASAAFPTNDEMVVHWNSRQGLRLGDASVVSTSVPSSTIVCRFEQPPSWERVMLDISYLIKGFDWQAHYQMAVRGEREDEKEPVSVDLTGIARIQNRCSIPFRRAVVQLAGSDTLPRDAVSKKEPGILLFPDDSPLTDLWKPTETETPVEHLYPLPGTVDLPAHGDAQLYFSSVVRKPADRLYVMHSEDIPLDSYKTGRALKKAIVFKNDEAHGLGFNIPVGDAQIFLGGMKTHLLQNAWLPHTPAGNEIRMNLGWAENVKGIRKTLNQVDTSDGFLESTYEIDVANLSGKDIRVEISEKPPVVLEWSVVRSSKPYQLQAQRILFVVDIPADNEERIEYRLRIRKPKL